MTERDWIEMVIVGSAALILFAWHIHRLTWRVGSLERGMKGLATSARLEEVYELIKGEINKLKADGEREREQSLEAMKAQRALTDQQFAFIGQLSSRMDFYVADELQRARTAAERRPAAILEPG